MKQFLSNLPGYVFAVFLGLFAVTLCGQALNGNPYAIVLLVWELANVIFPFVIDESKIPKWLEKTWLWSIVIWFVCAAIWSANQLNFI